MDRIIRESLDFSLDVALDERIKIGEKCQIHNSVVIGTPPQHLDFYYQGKRHDGKIIIGDNVVIREFVNIHLPTRKDTIIEDNCFIMSHCHIAHDCVLEEKVILATGTHLAGHTHIMRGAKLGLNCCTHQYTTIGSYAMIGMGSVITKDVPPFSVFNNKYGCYRINKVGMIRSGFTLKEAFDLENYYLFHHENMSGRVAKEVKRFQTLRNPSRAIYPFGIRIS